jgi:hypothetical protein
MVAWWGIDVTDLVNDGYLNMSTTTASNDVNAHNGYYLYVKYELTDANVIRPPPVGLFGLLLWNLLFLLQLVRRGRLSQLQVEL